MMRSSDEMSSRCHSSALLVTSCRILVASRHIVSVAELYITCIRIDQPRALASIIPWLTVSCLG